MKLFFLQRLAYFLSLLIQKTCRYEYRNREVLQSFGSSSTVFAVWHEHLFGVLCCLKGQPFATMASKNKDGSIINYVLNRFGFRTTRGSSNKGGLQGVVALADLMQQQVIHGCLAVDGPRGPRRKCKSGVIYLADQVKSPVIGIDIRFSNCWEFSSWDRFKLPKFFSTVVITFSEPIPVCFADSAKSAGAVEDCLNNLNLHHQGNGPR